MHDPRELAAVFAGGVVGAIARAGVAEALPVAPGQRPWATFLVNVTGVVVGARIGGDARTLVATGLLGAFTTFSTWIVDSRRLGERAGAANLAGSLALGLLAVWLGRELGALL